MQILVTGASGQVALAFAKELRPLGDLCLTNRRDLDLSKPHAIPKRLDEIKPDLIINAAAYTAVDKAESSPTSPTPSTGARSAPWASGPREKACL